MAKNSLEILQHILWRRAVTSRRRKEACCHFAPPKRGVLSLRAAEKRRAVTSRRRKEACCKLPLYKRACECSGEGVGSAPPALLPSLAKRGATCCHFARSRGKGRGWGMLSLRAVKRERIGVRGLLRAAEKRRAVTSRRRKEEYCKLPLYKRACECSGEGIGVGIAPLFPSPSEPVNVMGRGWGWGLCRQLAVQRFH
jgi:hypothetical protein